MAEIENIVWIVAATVTTSLLALLALLRMKINGHHALLSLGNRWTAVPTSTSAGVQALLAAVALSAFAAIPEHRSQPPAATAVSTLPEAATFETDGDVAALRSYASAIDSKPHATAPAEPLPGVDEMITKLKTRLDQNPTDVKGWKMLGWSYLNTGDAASATRAYEQAQKLAPTDAEITAALSAAKSAAAEK